MLDAVLGALRHLGGVAWRVAQGIEGMSFAALRVLVTRGPTAARHVLGETVRAARASERQVQAWDLVRAFAVDEHALIHSGSWFDGGVSPLERYLIALLARYFKPELVLEVGTFRGSSTRLLLDNTARNTRIYTLDLPPRRDFTELRGGTDEHLVLDEGLGVEFRDHAERHRVTQVLGNSAEESTWRDVPSGIAFAFIDASHSYEAVKADTGRARHKLGAQAVILWHDYTQENSSDRGVGRYIREEMRTHRDIFVVANTTLAIRIPEAELRAADARAEHFFHAGDYSRRRPGGFAPWLVS